MWQLYVITHAHTHTIHKHTAAAAAAAHKFKYIECELILFVCLFVCLVMLKGNEHHEWSSWLWIMIWSSPSSTNKQVHAASEIQNKAEQQQIKNENKNIFGCLLVGCSRPGKTSFLAVLLMLHNTCCTVLTNSLSLSLSLLFSFYLTTNWWRSLSFYHSLRIPLFVD